MKLTKSTEAYGYSIKEYETKVNQIKTLESWLSLTAADKNSVLMCELSETKNELWTENSYDSEEPTTILKEKTIHYQNKAQIIHDNVNVPKSEKESEMSKFSWLELVALL